MIKLHDYTSKLIKAYADLSAIRGESGFTMTRKKAKAIATDFLSKRNPMMWDGKGEKPEGFHYDYVTDNIITYDINSRNNNDLDISFEIEDGEWTHYCELVDKDDGLMIECLHGYGINSINNLTDTILDICRNE